MCNPTGKVYLESNIYCIWTLMGQQIAFYTLITLEYIISLVKKVDWGLSIDMSSSKTEGK